MPDLATHAAAAKPARADTTRLRAALLYAVAGDLRFLSHRDEMRMLERTIVRAGWPLRWSQGFNPQPRISVLLPRSVGMASDCQCALIGLTELRPAADLHGSLRRSLPAGVILHELLAPATGRTPQPCRVLYAVELDGEECPHLAERGASLLAAPEVLVSRRPAPGKPPRTVDVRPYIDSLNLTGRVLWMRLTFDGQRSARPTEVLSALGLDGERLAHRLRRAEVAWNMPLTAAPTVFAAAERNSLGQETIETSAQADQTG
jgi:radical SAM-linked protein